MQVDPPLLGRYVVIRKNDTDEGEDNIMSINEVDIEFSMGKDVQKIFILFLKLLVGEINNFICPSG